MVSELVTVSRRFPPCAATAQPMYGFGGCRQRNVTLQDDSSSITKPMHGTPTQSVGGGAAAGRRPACLLWIAPMLGVNRSTLKYELSSCSCYYLDTVTKSRAIHGARLRRN